MELVDDGASSSNFANIEHLGELVSKMLNRALDAFARMNVEDALKTIAMDEKINVELGYDAPTNHAHDGRPAHD